MMSQTPRIRLRFNAVCLGAVLSIATAGHRAMGAERSTKSPAKIKAFCVDFNWGAGGPNAFAKPGLWADASPARHVRWYKDLGANVIQTFCVSCNGYAWYKGGVVPGQPGLKADFLRDVVKLGHQDGMKVMGYYCVGANTLWGQTHPDLSYGIPNSPHIPFTKAYLAYLASSIADAVKKTGIDGFMIDWVWLPTRKSTKGKWLACEKTLYQELMGKPFPGEGTLTQEQEVEYGRKAIDRCWTAIHRAAKAANPDCVIWLSCHSLDHPHVRGSKMFRQIDWLMNENPDPTSLADARKAIGPHARIVQCLCGWGDKHDAAKVVDDPSYKDVGFYGFAKPDASSLPHVPSGKGLKLTGNAKNIETLRRAFHVE